MDQPDTINQIEFQNKGMRKDDKKNTPEFTMFWPHQA